MRVSRFSRGPRVVERAGRRIETIVILGRPKEIIIEAGLRTEGERRRDMVVRIQFDGIVLGPVLRIERGFDDSQIARLCRAGIGVEFAYHRNVERG